MDSAQHKVQCVENMGGHWRVEGVPREFGNSETFRSRERALEDTFEKIGPLESWQLVMINRQGREIGCFNSVVDAMHWHVN